MKKLVNFVKKNEQLFVLLVFIFSWAIRLAYLHYKGQFNIYEGDEGVYGQLGQALAQGKGYVFDGQFYTTRMPLTAVVAGLSSWIFGYSVFKIHILSTLLGSLIPVAGYYLARKFSPQDYTVPVLTALYAMVYPFFIHEASFIDNENVFIPIFLVYLAALLTIEIKPNFKKYFIAGVLLGFSMLARATLNLFLIFYAVYLLFKKWPIKNILHNIIVQGICMLLILAPWSYILSKNTGSLAFLTLGTNSSIIGGTNAIVLNDKELAGSWVNLYRDYPGYIQKLHQEVKSTGKPVSEFSLTLQVVKTNLAKIPWLMWRKCVTLWGYSPKHPDHRNLKDDLVGLFAYGWLLPCLLISLIIGRQKQIPLFILFGVYYSFMTMITSGTMRFRLPLDIFIIILVFELLINRKKYKSAK